MPPTFLYLLFLGLWVLMAVAVWIVAAVLFLLPRQRQTGRQLAAAMAGTFPGVLIYQLLATPIVVAVLGAAWFLWRTLEPGSATVTSNPLVIMAWIVSAGLAFVVVVTMSLTGFWEGWRVGWAFGAGKDVRSVVRSGPLFRLAAYVRNRVRLARDSA